MVGEKVELLKQFIDPWCISSTSEFESERRGA